MKDIKTAEEFRKSFIKVSKPNHMNMILESAYRIDEMLKAYAEYYHKAKVERDNRMLNYVLDTFRQIKNIYRKGKEETALDRSINQSEEFLNKLLNDL